MYILYRAYEPSLLGEATLVTPGSFNLARRKFYIAFAIRLMLFKV